MKQKKRKQEENWLLMFIKKLTVPENVEISVDLNKVTVKGPNAEISRLFNYPRILIKKDKNGIIIEAPNDKKVYKRIVNTWLSHIRNLISGSLKDFECKLKICSSHFPMTVKVSDKEILVENFFGRKKPGKTKIVGNTKVKIDGNVITVSGPNIEGVSQTAANIERTTRLTKKDRRRFQDGIWIFKKAK